MILSCQSYQKWKNRSVYGTTLLRRTLKSDTKKKIIDCGRISTNSNIY
jgi:hypothetical protein